MYFHDPAERATKELAPGVVTRTYWGEKMLISMVDIDPGAEAALHSHPHEQVGTVIRGTVRFTIGEESRQLGPGDIFTIPGGVEHAATAGPDGATVMDVFSPVREEFKY
jgi:quercetin dioxygenase-like cupin family protein